MTDTPQANPFVQARDAFNKAILEHRSSIQWLAQYRFWLLLTALATLLCPVLMADGTVRMGWHDGVFQTGAEVAVPSVWLFANGTVHTRTAWGINPIALALYGIVAYLVWIEFSKQPLAASRRVKLVGIVVLLALSLPVTFVPICNIFVPKVSSAYGIVDFAWGWTVLVLSSVALWLPLHADQLAGGIPQGSGPDTPVEVPVAAPIPTATPAPASASAPKGRLFVWVVLIVAAFGLWKWHENRVEGEAVRQEAIRNVQQSIDAANAAIAQ